MRGGGGEGEGRRAVVVGAGGSARLVRVARALDDALELLGVVVRDEVHVAREAC